MGTKPRTDFVEGRCYSLIAEHRTAFERVAATGEGVPELQALSQELAMRLARNLLNAEAPQLPGALFRAPGGPKAYLLPAEAPEHSTILDGLVAAGYLQVEVGDQEILLSPNDPDPSN